MNDDSFSFLGYARSISQIGMDAYFYGSGAKIVNDRPFDPERWREKGFISLEVGAGINVEYIGPVTEADWRDFSRYADEIVDNPINDRLAGLAIKADLSGGIIAALSIVDKITAGEPVVPSLFEVIPRMATLAGYAQLVGTVTYYNLEHLSELSDKSKIIANQILELGVPGGDALEGNLFNEALGEDDLSSIEADADSTTVAVIDTTHGEVASNVGGFDGEGPVDRDGDGEIDGYDWGGGTVQPIVFDLDGDGIEVSSGLRASFDFDGDKFKESGAWAAGGDGFLVIDRQTDGSTTPNADGTIGDNKITQADELILSRLTDNASDTDLEAVRNSWLNSDISTAAFKGSDGVTRQIQVLDKRDSGWAHLRVWRDLDQDGEVDGELQTSQNGTGELFTLEAFKITRINLGYDDGSDFSDKEDDVTVGLVSLHGLASYVRETDGGFETISGGVGDMSLGHADLGWKLVDLADGRGHEYQFENGKRWRYAKIESPNSAAFNLTAAAYDAAQGDSRNNDLNATGSARAVQISGGAGADTLRGGGSDDVLVGDAGADNIWGSEGNDLLVIDIDDLNSGLGGYVNGGQGMDTLMVGDDRGVSLVLGNYAAEAGIGGAGKDSISGVGQYGDVLILGKGGDDTLKDGFGDDLLSGDDGNDNLYAADGDDALFGGNGTDKLFSGSGDDQLYGGSHNDSLIGESGDDLLYGDFGNDTLRGDSGDDRLFGGNGVDSLIAGGDDDTLEGGAGNDTLSFWRGDAELYGQDGDDTFQLEYAASPRWAWAVLFGGTGVDTLVLDGTAQQWSFDVIKNHAGGNQWQLYRNISASEKMVIDIVDIEKIQFNGSNQTVVLSAYFKGGSETSTSYTGRRESWGTYIGDDVASGQKVDPGYTGGFYSNGVMNGWMGNDSLTGWSNTGMIDAIAGGSGADTLSGVGGSDSLMGNSGQDVLLGGDASDTIDGGAGTDQAAGGEGNDSLVSGSGSDIVWGDSGNDSVYGGSGNDVMLGGTGTDRLYGGSGADQVSGGTQADTLYGDTGYDRLYGDDGDDQLFGGAGSDYLYGGLGNDTLTGDDSLGSGFNYLSGGEGSDRLVGGEMDDQLSGDSGNDTLIGGAGRDVLMGGASADSLDGGAGITDAVSYESSQGGVTVDLATQTASGGDASGANSNDTLAGFEQAIGGLGGDTMSGSDADNMLSGGTGTDTLDGRGGDDDLFGGDGADTLNGSAGVDRLYGGAENDSLLGGDGEDTLNGHDDHDTLRGGNHNDLVDGDGGNDSLLGDSGDDTLHGDTGNDKLIGGFGADVLIGGAGSDQLYGGNDAGTRDLFRFFATSESAVGAARDVIYDFVSGADDIDLSGIDANSTSGGDQSFNFNGVTAKANSIWYKASGSSIIVYGDLNGNTTADFEIEVKDIGSVVVVDFLL